MIPLFKLIARLIAFMVIAIGGISCVVVSLILWDSYYTDKMAELADRIWEK